MADGVMIAFYVPRDIATRMQLSNIVDSEKPEDLHLTLVYLGEMDKMQVAKDEVADIIRVFANGHRVISGTLGGVARFNGNEGNGKQAFVALFDSPDLPRFRQELFEALGELVQEQNHGFTPHITLAYIDEDSASPVDSIEAEELTFTKLVLAWGNEHFEYPLQPQTKKKGINMPYELYEDNGKWCVKNKETGEGKGCSASKEMAIQHMRALYAHEPGTKSGPLSLQMTITKAEKTSQGFVRWRARCNTGEVDAQNEKFDGSFWLDIVHNFMQVQKALSASEKPPLPVPILDVAHYSMFLGADRMKARAGWPNRLWIDGKALMAEGFYDDTPLGKASAQAGMRPDDKRPKISICVYPDWGNVSVEDGVLTYKGGRDVAYLDHLAQTMYPVNANTDIVAEVPMEAKSTIAQDATEVLGDEELAKKLEEARAAAKSTATIPEGAVIKADDTSGPETSPVAADAGVVAEQPVDKAARKDVSEADKKRAEKEYGDVAYADEENKKYPIDTEEHIRAAWSYINMPKNAAMYADKGAAIKAKIVAAWKRVIDKEGPPKAEEKSEAEVTPEPQPEAKSDTSAKYDALAQLVVSLSETLPKALQDLSETVKGLQADVEALKVSETAKVKSAIDNGGSWLAQFYNPRKDAGNVVPADEAKKVEPKSQSVGQMEGVWGYIADAVNKTPPGG